MKLSKLYTGDFGDCSYLDFDRPKPPDPDGHSLGWDAFERVHGCPHPGEWVPVPARSGHGWQPWYTADDYNRYFRQSIDDGSTIEGAPETAGGLNGRPKFLDLRHYASGPAEAAAFTAAHPGILAVLPGWYSEFRWEKKHGGDDQVHRLGVFWSDGGNSAGAPPGWTGSSTGWLVIGSLAAVAGGLAALGVGSVAGSAGAGASSGFAGGVGPGFASLGEQVLQQLPGAVIGSHGDLSNIGTGLLGSLTPTLQALGSDALSAVGSSFGDWFSNIGGDLDMGWLDDLKDTVGDIGSAIGTAGDAWDTFGSIFGHDQSLPPPPPPPETGGGTHSTALSSDSGSMMPFALAIGGLLLLAVMFRGK